MPPRKRTDEIPEQLDNEDLQSFVTRVADEMLRRAHRQALQEIIHTVQGGFGTVIPPARRGPGRPRKDASPFTGIVPQRRGPGRPRKDASPFAGIVPVARTAGTRPKQLCPVPGCKNVAAPIFGMVCKDHRGTPKAEIKKYRAARKAEKSGLPQVTGARRAKRIPITGAKM